MTMSLFPKAKAPVLIHGGFFVFKSEQHYIQSISKANNIRYNVIQKHIKAHTSYFIVHKLVLKIKFSSNNVNASRNKLLRR